ncbi:MAG: hypothetical protein ABIP69_04675 [Ferruginibacter sp.]
MLLKTISDAIPFPLVHNSNHWIMNIESVLEFFYFSYFFYQILKNNKYKKLIKVFVMAYPIILAISFLTVQNYYTFHTYTYILGELYLITLCLFFYRELYTDNDFKKLSTLPEFWIVTGLFIFSVGELPYMILLNYLNTHHRLISRIFRINILGSLNILMYIMFSIGLLCRVRVQK